MFLQTDNIAIWLIAIWNWYLQYFWSVVYVLICLILFMLILGFIGHFYLRVKPSTQTLNLTIREFCTRLISLDLLSLQYYRWQISAEYQIPEIIPAARSILLPMSIAESYSSKSLTKFIEKLIVLRKWGYNLQISFMNLIVLFNWLFTIATISLFVFPEQLADPIGWIAPVLIYLPLSWIVVVCVLMVQIRNLARHYDLLLSKLEEVIPQNDLKLINHFKLYAIIAKFLILLKPWYDFWLFFDLTNEIDWIKSKFSRGTKK